MLHKNNKKTHKKAKQFPNNTTQRMNIFFKTNISKSASS